MGTRLVAALRRPLRLGASARLAILVFIMLPAVVMAAMLASTAPTSATAPSLQLATPTLTATDSLAHHYTLAGAGCVSGHVTADVTTANPTTPSNASTAGALPKIETTANAHGDWSSPLVFTGDVPIVPLRISAQCQVAGGIAAYPAVAFDLAAQLCQAGQSESITAAVKPGGDVSFSGCFDPKESVFVTLDGGSAPVAILLADSEGLASVDVVLPATIGVGPHTLTATGQTSHLQTNEPFTVATDGRSDAKSGVDAITITATPLPSAATDTPVTAIASAPDTNRVDEPRRFLLFTCVMLAGGGIALAYARTKDQRAGTKPR